MTSSAGWKSSRNRPPCSPRLCSSAEREPGPDEGRGVDVVAAGVGDTRRGARPGVSGGVVDRQGVEVGAQRDDRS